MKQTWIAGVLILACLMIEGCETESERLGNLAERTIEMQSQQNATIAKTTTEMVEFNREIQAERKELTQGHKQLENDRRDLHRQRRTELAWAESFQFLAITIAASMPLFLCAYLIWASTRSTDDAELLNEVLMQELVSKQPRLIAGPNRPAIELQPDSKERKCLDNDNNLSERNK